MCVGEKFVNKLVHLNYIIYICKHNKLIPSVITCLVMYY